MLELKIMTKQSYDDSTKRFIEEYEIIKLEHSLLSLSKWESKHHKHYLNNQNLSIDEEADYIRFMCVDHYLTDKELNLLSDEDINKIKEYMLDDHTATTINNYGSSRPTNEIITSELIYYWMTALNIPFECEKWNLSRLLMLCQVCAIKNDTSNKKRPVKDVLSEQARLNAERRMKYNTRG